MKPLASVACTLLSLAATVNGVAAATNPGAGNTPGQDPLFVTISKLDSELFDSFNRCASADQLAKHASYFAPRPSADTVATRKAAAGLLLPR